MMATAADVARASDVVVTILPADAELNEIVLGGNGLREGFSAGKVLIDMTTATGMSLLQVERELAPRGGRGFGRSGQRRHYGGADGAR